MKGSWRWAAVAGTLAAAAGLVGSSVAGTTGSAAVPAYVVKAKQIVAQNSQLRQKFPMPTEKVDPGDRTVAIITGGNISPIHFEQGKVALEAVEAIGWKGTVYDGKFSPATQAALIDQAVQRGDDAVIAISFNINATKAAVENALKKGVAFGCSMCLSGDSWVKKGVLDVAVSFKRQGELAAWFAIAHSGGKVKAVTFEEPAYPQTTHRRLGFEHIIKTQCPTCSIVKSRVVVPAADLGKPGPPGVNAMLTSLPKGSFNYIQTYSDDLVIPLVKTLHQAGRTEIVAIGFDAQTPSIRFMKDGDPTFGASVGLPYDFTEWLTVDSVARKLAGQKLFVSRNLPNVIVSPRNVRGYKPYLEPAGDWRLAFKKLWGTA